MTSPAYRFWTVFLAGVCMASVCSAQGPDRESCARAHLVSQQARQASSLLEARKHLFVCAAQACPDIIQEDCGRWLQEVQSSIPTVVFGALGADGKDIADASVTDGDTTLASKLDGKPVALDPGEHTFVFHFKEHAPVSVTASLRAGAKNRSVLAQIPQSDTAPGTETTGPPTAFWVLAGVGTAGLISFGTFAALGESQYQDLKSSCSPACSADDTKSVDTKFLIADISLGVAALAYAGAAYFYFSPRSREQAPARTETRLVFRPTAGGAFLGVRGAL